MRANRFKPKSRAEKNKEGRLVPILAITGTLVSVVSTIIAYRSCTLSPEIAERSGAFDRPMTSFSINEMELPTTPDDTIRVYYGGVFDSLAVNLSAFPLQLQNAGKKDAEDISVVIEYPLVSGMGLSDSFLQRNNALPVPGFSRSFSTDDKQSQVVYALRNLHPGMRLTFADPIRLHPTELHSTVMLRDSASIGYTVHYSNIVVATLLAKDLPARRNIFAISCSEASHIDTIINQYMQKVIREKGKAYGAFFIFPSKQVAFAQKDTIINEYPICETCIYYGLIEDAAPDKELILALYQHGKLVKVKVYSKDNIFIRDLEMRGR